MMPLVSRPGGADDPGAARQGGMGREHGFRIADAEVHIAIKAELVKTFTYAGTSP